jgi:hypothetical protein
VEVAQVLEHFYLIYFPAFSGPAIGEMCRNIFAAQIV